MKQCWFCTNFHFLKPLSDETFSYCPAWKETVASIDLQIGCSEAILKYGTMGTPCKKFKFGTSPCEIAKSDPFTIPAIRREGEEWLRKKLGAN